MAPRKPIGDYPSTRAQSLGDKNFILERLTELREAQVEGDKQNAERFSRVEVHMATTNQALETLVSIEHAVMGNGEVGLKTKMDRVERTLKVFTTTIAIIGTATVGLVFKLIYGAIVLVK